MLFALLKTVLFLEEGKLCVVIQTIDSDPFVNVFYLHSAPILVSICSS